jgi:hypothetical protein
MSNGYILYEGPSRLNGEKIVVIVTGLKTPSRNTKTGEMLQVWIMCMDVSPIDAVKPADGFPDWWRHDAAVCGDCKHKPSNLNSCYVNLGQAPLQVWKAYKRGSYPVAPTNWRDGIDTPVRWGAYGDPLAMPRRIFKVQKGDTAYSHQWKRFASSGAMASVDSWKELTQARLKGIKAFRVTSEQELAYNEIWCPATVEGGSKTNCADCGLCSGWVGKSIVVMAHGATASNFI